MAATETPFIPVCEALVVGDLHITAKSNDAINSVEDLLLDILEADKESKIQFVVFLGDTLHEHGQIDLRCKVRAIALFRRIAELVDVLVLVGNHDIFHNQYEGSVHAFYGVDIANVVFASEPLWYREHFLVIPYKPKGRWQPTLDSIPNWQSAWAIFAHQEFRGAKLESGLASRDGDTPSVGPSIISGHIHTYQQLATAESYVLYAGTPYATRFGEDDDKAILHCQWDNLGGLEFKRIPVAAPKKVTLSLDLDQFQQGPAEDVSRETTRVFVNVNDTEFETFRQTDAYAKWLAKGVVPMPRVTRTPNEKRTVEPVSSPLYVRVKSQLPETMHARLDAFWRSITHEQT